MTVLNHAEQVAIRCLANWWTWSATMAKPAGRR